ncbi:MAG TPA: hypothetical protein VM099_15670 [Gemmatimonadaceae bacterium]|nr:hypothetical protein [Gemmatimonadaceae bacterium]
MRYSVIAIALLSVAACRSKQGAPAGPAPEPVVVAKSKAPIATSGALIREMHDRYAGKWYKTLTFEQTNTFYTSAGKEQKSHWLQRLQVPGRLRIDFLPLASRSGMLIQNNRVMTFDNGRRVDSRRSIQPVLTMTGDVYAIPPSITLRRLDSLGIDLDRFHDGKWDGRKVYVMGAEKGDLQSNQIWVDADKLLLVRLIQKDKRGDRIIVTDTHVGEYREVDGYNVAFEFTSYRDGKVFFKEKYDNVKVNEAIPSALFDATRWVSVPAASP